MNARQKLFEDPPTSFPDGRSLEQRFMEQKVAREAGKSAETEVLLRQEGREEKSPRSLLLPENENEVEARRKNNESEGCGGDFEGDWDKGGGRPHSCSETNGEEGGRGRWTPIHKRGQSEGNGVQERWRPSGKWNTREQLDNRRSREKRETRWSVGRDGLQPSSLVLASNKGGRRYSWASREDRSRFCQPKALQKDWRAREGDGGSEILDTRDRYCDLESTHYIQSALSAMAHSYNHPRIPTFLSEILELVNGSLGGQTLKFVVDTMFQIAPTTEDHVTGRLSLPIYAEFSLSLTKFISPDTADKGIKASYRRPLSGSNLAKVYISEKCNSLVKKEQGLVNSTVPRMPLFFGELHQHDLCPDGVVIVCVNELLGRVNLPEADSLRTLCELLKITGKKLYRGNKTRAVVDKALNHIRRLNPEEGTDNTVRLALLEILDQREFW
ncbi:unnamed protein product [Tuber aestivum]|uniref:MIF4G domain-containing protein n=1 Tax=Tuber aestivum TaxID=59557 RepID=A0A292PY93_9PEZI|nr:unnamed protein product [Tuber aestivum]